jgi:hypothetical protein
MRRGDAMKMLMILVAILACSARSRAADFDLQIEPHDLEISLHEPVVVQMTLINLTGESTVADLGNSHVGAFRITVTGPDGQKRDAPPPRMPGGVSVAGGFNIPALASFTRPLILNEWYAFEEPGSYRVEVSLPGVGRPASISPFLREMSIDCA